MTCDHEGNVECTASTARQTSTTRGTTRQTTTTLVTLPTISSSSTRVTTTTTVYTTTTTTTKKYERQTEIIPIRIHPVKEEDLLPILPVDNDINDDKIETKFIPDNENSGETTDNKLAPVNDDVYTNTVDNENTNNYLVSKTNTDPALGSEKVA